jgi:hypothetical protein
VSKELLEYGSGPIAECGILHNPKRKKIMANSAFTSLALAEISSAITDRCANSATLEF